MDIALDLSTIKMLLGISSTDTSSDKIITYIGNAVSTDAKKYCRIPVITDDLQLIINDMVIDRYRARGYGQQDAPQTVTKVSEGDVEVDFKTVQYNATMELTDAEKKRLVPFRKLWS